MEKLSEVSKSNWECVSTLMKGEKPIVLGQYASHWYYETPRRMLHAMSYYKFAAKMIGSQKRVLDIGCNEGLGTWLLAKECGFCRGLDFDEEAIHSACQNFEDPSVEFVCADFLSIPESEWDAVVNFDVVEHIMPENAPHFFEKMARNLAPHGVAIVGTPSAISQQFASSVSRRGHINIYNHERLEEEMRRYFRYVFLFSANDEVVHTGFLPLAHYYIALACGKCL